ncbi:MAG: radical SAM protein [Clostridium sp.]|uniref:radical SAM protein n=1 Tax=Clostridium sp. TaxID=1506 RepID=UPI002A909B50|nr:radical SAM protein [Clostridium sp.]MDY6229091.1 radical SAM protein [Clostridium sp.]
MKYSEFVIVLGKKCTADCDICCLDCKLTDNECIDINRIKEFIRSAEEIDEITTIHFSGGEAFLYYDKLIELVKLCTKIDKATTVITNGFWAYDYYETLEKLQHLKQVGLKAVGVSYDEFHLKYIKLENIRNIIKACKELDLKVTIQTCIVKGSQNGNWIDTLGDDLVDIALNFIACDKVGRATDKIKDDKFIRSYKPINCICRKGGSFSVLYDGTVWPCCSPYVFTTELCVGNIYKDIETVKDALKRLENNLVLKVLRNKGFNFFKDIVINDIKIEVPNKIISSCELCNLFFNKDIIVKIIPKIFDKLKKDEIYLKEYKNEL